MLHMSTTEPEPLAEELAISHQVTPPEGCNGTANLAGRKNREKPITQVQEERWNKVRRKVVIAVERIFISPSFSFLSSAIF